MAEKTMHHAVIGNDTFELVDQSARADVSELKNAFNSTNEFNGINTKKVKGAYINSGNGKWTANADYSILLAQVNSGDRISIVAGAQNTYYVLLTDNDITVGQAAHYAGSATTVTLLSATGSASFTVPSDAKYLYVTYGTPSTDRTPSVLVANGISLLNTVAENINTAKNESNEYISSVLNGNNYTYTATGTSYKVPFVIKEGHMYQITSEGIAVNINYAEYYGGTVYNLVNNVGGSNKIKMATAEHSGSILSIASSTGNVNVTIQDVTFEMNLKKNIIIDQNGNGDFTTLRAGIAYAIKFPHSEVFVREGTYDLLTEFATEIANSSTENYGILLDNDVHVVFSSGAKVTALYQITDNADHDKSVEEHFQPFYVSSSNIGGFTLENLDIKASACRYCVHDEYGGANVIINNHYKNCRMEMDNTEARLKYYPQCIGGGTGKHTYVDIEGCYFKSKRAETQDTPLVSYHNAASVQGAKSFINVHDSYFADDYGTFRAIYHGVTEEVSMCYLSGNSFGIAPEIRAMSAQSVIENFDILEWNNVVRNP